MSSKTPTNTKSFPRRINIRQGKLLFQIHKSVNKEYRVGCRNKVIWIGGSGDSVTADLGGIIVSTFNRTLVADDVRACVVTYENVILNAYDCRIAVTVDENPRCMCGGQMIARKYATGDLDLDHLLAHTKVIKTPVGSRKIVSEVDREDGGGGISEHTILEHVLIGAFACCGSKLLNNTLGALGVHIKTGDLKSFKAHSEEVLSGHTLNTNVFHLQMSLICIGVG